MHAILALLTLLIAVSVEAQSSRTLTVDEAIRRAKDRAPERIRAEALGQQSGALRRNAATFFSERPELEVEYISERPFGERDYELSIALRQEIPIWGISARRTDLADAVQRSSEATQTALENRVTLRTRLLYNRAWSLSQQIALGNRLIAASTRLAEATNKRLEAGDISRLERNTVALAANSIRIDHERVHSEYDQAIGELAALIGEDLRDVVLIVDTFGFETFSLDTAITYSLSPEWIQLEHEIRIAEARLELAKAETGSNPTLGMHYAQDLLTVDGDQIVYHQDAPRAIEAITAHGKAAGVSLSMQLPLSIPGLWGPDNSEVIEREAELRSLEADQAALQLQLAGRIARLRPRLNRIGAALKIYNESVDLVDENHELLDKGYEGGELSVTDLLVSRQQLIELQTEQLELTQEMREAEIELQSILGQ